MRDGLCSMDFLSEFDSRKRRLVSHTMSDDDYVVQRMLDGESEEDGDEPIDTNVELPLGAGVDQFRALGRSLAGAHSTVESLFTLRQHFIEP